MNRLEQYVRDHKNLFDEEPATGHFERLQEKMNRKPRQIIAWRWGISIAASIALLISAGIIWLYPGKQNDLTVVCENANDMKICYLDKMNAVADKIEALSQNLDQWDKQQVMTDVQNIIDAANSDFGNEIPEELPEDKAKSILSDYYRQNLEGLNMIAEKLRFIN